MDYSPPQPPPDLPSPQHFQPQDIGMDPQIGGMGREDWQTWTPSNVLIPKATEQFTPQAQVYFANRKLNRQPPPDSADSRDGQYVTNSGSVYVRRIGRDGSYPSPLDEQRLATHELIHAASYEHPSFSSDLHAGLPALRKAIADSGWSIPPAIENDPDHIFTGAAEALLSGQTAPAPRDYFAPLLR